jgi:predicted Zn-dependent peptidase
MEIRKQELKNGLVILTDAMPQVRSVSVGVWMRVGSRHENAETQGISHFIEHLLFKGTRTRNAGAIAEAIDSVGGQLNAFTDKEYVGFYAKVLDEHLPEAFEILADIVLNPTFPSAEVERERNVIFEEINMVEDSPQEAIHDIFLESFWPRHPLGRAISGTKSSVGRIRRRDVLRHFRQNYTACNMVVAAAGNIRHGQVQRLAAKWFSELSAGTPAEAGSPPAASPSRVVRHKEHLEQMHLCLGTVSPSLTSKERYPAHLLSHILGGGVSSRLFQNIREKRGLVYDIDSTLDMYVDAGSLVVYAGTAPKNAARVVDLARREFRRIREKAVADDELRRAKEFLKSSVVMSLESPSSRMTQLAQQEIYYRRSVGVGEVLRRIDRITTGDVRRVAEGLFGAGPLAMVALGSRNGHELERVSLEL